MSSHSSNFSFAQLANLAHELASGELSPAEACARYLLLHLHARQPAQWLSGPRAKTNRLSSGLLSALEALGVSLSHRQRERLKHLPNVHELFCSFFFRGVVLDSHEGMVGWLEKRYPLYLRLDIPTPDEMLAAQCEGVRFVTLLIGGPAQFQTYGRHADACAFMLHDFEHAHKFFGDENSFRGQLRFFRALRASITAFARWNDDPQFVKDLDYLKADMNSHPVHLIKYLKAVVLSAEMRETGLRHPPLDGFWRELFKPWGMKDRTLESALKINQPESETESDLISVAEFFMMPFHGDRHTFSDLPLPRKTRELS